MAAIFNVPGSSALDQCPTFAFIIHNKSIMNRKESHLLECCVIRHMAIVKEVRWRENGNDVNLNQWYIQYSSGEVWVCTGVEYMWNSTHIYKENYGKKWKNHESFVNWSEICFEGICQAFGSTTYLWISSFTSINCLIYSPLWKQPGFFLH